MMVSNFEYIVRDSQEKALGSVIWLHGLGADGHDFADIVPQLNLPQHLALRFIFPHAPIRPVTINANMNMRAWYDIYHLDRILQEDKEGLEQSRILVENLIENELEKGISEKNIILAGFSQGGALSLYAGLRYPKTLGGIIALSCYLPLLNETQQMLNPTNQNIPIMMAHGTFDQVLPIELARMSYQYLKELSLPVEWFEYPMEHNVCPQEIKNISAWLQQRFL